MIFAREFCPYGKKPKQKGVSGCAPMENTRELHAHGDWGLQTPEKSCLWYFFAASPQKNTTDTGYRSLPDKNKYP
jgi:hypothetical protein